MGTPGTDIFLIPVDGRYLVHAPLHRVTALVNPAAARQLGQALTDGRPQPWMAAGLKPLAERLLGPSAERPLARTGPFAPRRLNLFVTGDCNLACRYCVPRTGGTPKETMPRRLCSAALEGFAAIAARDRLPDFTVYLHGGEPLLHLDIVRFCLAEGKRQAQRLGVPFYVSATTNGCLPHETAQWVAAHFHFLIVSMDGPPEVHDRQRPGRDGKGSFTTTAAFVRTLKKRGRSFGIRCTVAAPNEAQLADWTRFFCDTFGPRVIVFEPATPPSGATAPDLAPPDPQAFAEAVMEASTVARKYGAPGPAAPLPNRPCQPLRGLRPCGGPDDRHPRRRSVHLLCCGPFRLPPCRSFYCGTPGLQRQRSAYRLAAAAAGAGDGRRVHCRLRRLFLPLALRRWMPHHPRSGPRPKR